MTWSSAWSATAHAWPRRHRSTGMMAKIRPPTLSGAGTSDGSARCAAAGPGATWLVCAEPARPGPGLCLWPSAPAALAVGLGGTLLAYRALHKLTVGLVHLTGAALAWQQIAPLVTAATHPEVSSAPATALALAQPAGRGGTSHRSLRRTRSSSATASMVQPCCRLLPLHPHW